MSIDPKWHAREQWTLIEAAQICAGVNPYQGGPATDSPHMVSKQILDIDRRELFNELYARSKDAINQGSLALCERTRTRFVGNHRVTPSNYARWVMNISLPAPMEALIDKSSLARFVDRPRQPVGAAPDKSPVMASAHGRPKDVEKPQRQDALAIEIDEICGEMKAKGERITATVVIARLKKQSVTGGCVVDVASDGKKLQWERTSGKPEWIDESAIDKRISRWRQRSIG